MNRARLLLLGGFQLLDADGGEVGLSAKKAKGLLAFLALHPGQPHGREKLATMLWGDSGDEQARQSLRQALTALRRVMPLRQHLLAEGDQLLLAPESLEVDVAAFETLAQQQDIAPLAGALDLYQGELLEGLTTHAEEFDDWLMLERIRLRDRVTGVMERLLPLYRQTGQLEALQRVASRLLVLDPLREPVHRMLMECLAKRGRYSAALKQYRQCRRALQRELGIGPETATEDLYRQIMSWRQTTPHSPPQADAAPKGGANLPQPQAPEQAPELRQAVVLAIRLDGLPPADSPAGIEALCRHLDRYYALVDAEICANGGRILNRFNDLVVAAFGVPQAHDEDARSALQAAAAIREQLQRQGGRMTPRLGLASGPVLMCELGGQQFRQFSLVGAAPGRAVDLAQQAWAGQLLVADSFYHGIAELVDVAAGASGGYRRILTIHDVRIARRPMVGRKRELRQFRAALEDCLDSGHGEAFLIRGDAGIGKSRLLAACQDLARDAGFAVVTIANHGFGGRSASERQGLLGGLVQMLAEGSPQRLGEQGLLSSGQLALLLDQLRQPLSADARAELTAMDADALRRCSLEMVSGLLRATSCRQPLLLAIEDIHWAEQEQLHELAHWGTLTAVCPLLLIMTTRVEGEPLQPGWRGAMQGAALTTFDLASLRREELVALLEDVDADPQRIERCLQRSDGNPFFFIQLLQDISEDGEVPDNVQASVLARLDRLEPVDREAAQAAAVLDNGFSVDALRYLLDAPGYQPAPLLAAGLLRLDVDHLVFGHALIQESIYTALLQAPRRRWHQRAAAWFAERDPVLHAEHLDRAGTEEAAAAYLRAGRTLAAGYQAQQAVRLLTRGLELAQGAQRVELALLQGELLRDGGDIGRALQAFELACRCAADPVSRGQALWGKASCLHLRDQYQDALATLDEAESELPAAEAVELRAWIAYLRGNVLFPTGDMQGCLGCHSQALGLASECGSAELEARALSGLADVHYMSGRMQTAHDYFNRCVELSRRQGFRRIEVGNLSMRGLTAFYLNRPDEAIADAASAIGLARRIGHRRAELGGHIVIALFYLMQGELDRAEQHNRDGLELARQLGSRRFEGDCCLGLAEVLVERGQPQQAEPLLEQALIINGDDKAYMGPWLLATLARVTTDPARRREALAEAERMLGDGVISHNHFHFYEHAIYGAMLRQELLDARRYADALAAYTAGEQVPWAELMIRLGRLVAELAPACRDGQAERTSSPADLERLREDLRRLGYRRPLRLLQQALAQPRGA